MVKPEMSREWLLRVYATVGAVMTLALLPSALWTAGSAVEHPLNLATDATPDGKARVLGPPQFAGAKAVEIRYGNGPWAPAARFDAIRVRAGLPPGTPIAYRLELRGGAGQLVEGSVVRRSATASEETTAFAAVLPASLIALTVLLLVLTASGVRAMLACAALGGIGYILMLGRLDLTLMLVESAGVRSALVVLSRAYPFDLAFYLLFRLLEAFPGQLPSSSWKRWMERLLLTLGVLRYLMALLGEIPGFLESRLSQPAQARWLGMAGELQVGLIFLATLGAGALLVEQWSGYRQAAPSATERRKARLSGWLLFVGAAPGFICLAGQLIGRAATGANVIPNVFMRVAFVPLLLVPLAVVWVSLSGEIVPAKLLVHRAAVFLLARRTARVLSFVPLGVLVALFWVHREKPLGATLGAHPVAIAFAVMAIGALAWRESFQRAVERWVEPAPPNADLIVSAVGDRARNADSLADLGAAISAEIKAGFGVTDAALYVLDDTEGVFRAAGRDLAGLEADAPALETLRSQREATDLSAARALSRSAAADRQTHWARATGLALLLPLSGSGRHLVGFLGVGPKHSELDFGRADRLALRAVAAATSLAVENLRLRSTPDAAARAAGRIPGAAAVVAPGEEVALWCRSCGRVFRAAGGGLCAEDGSPLEPGDVPYVLAGRYLFERRLGAGGMGTVWGARDLTLGRGVAVKTLSRLSSSAAARFRREARAVARFIHPNIATILTAETWRGVPLLVFEYLEGGTLSQRVRGGVQAPSDVMRWGALLAGALDAAHEAGVLHRDVKPSNVGFTLDGTPKLLDFGLAAVFDDVEPPAPDAGLAEDPIASLERTVSRLTRSNAIVGTIPYLSPEAALGQVPGPGFDLWGLTLSLYEAVTGKNPFFAESVTATLNRILTFGAPDARTLRRECPSALAAVFARNLSSRREQRAHTAAILRAEFLALT